MSNEQGNSKTQAHLYISGRVQGVSFRWHTKQQAQRRGLTGWVRNLHDGRVETVIEGDEKDVQELVSWCHSGPSSARVSDVEVDYNDHSGKFKGFRISW